MALTSETHSCACCRNGRLHHLFTGFDRNQKTTERRFSIARCEQCGVVQTLPQPDVQELAAMYPRQYFLDFVGQETLQDAQQDKIALVRRHRKTGRLLDVGAGVGLFVRKAQAGGYDAQGLEISAHAVEKGIAALKVPLACGDFLTTDLPASHYDIVTFWHVLEHLADPQEILAKVHRILQPLGMVVIAVPNFGSIQSRLFRSRWYHLDVPRHLFHYTPKTLGALVERSGFRVQDVRYGWSEHDPAGLLGSIMRLSPPGESFVHKSIRKLAGMPVTNVLARLESSMHHGGTFALVATRE